MKDTANHPKLRFPGFRDNWIQSTLRSFSVINPKALKLPDTFIYIDLDSVDKGKLNKKQHISLANAPSRAQRLLIRGDILYQTVRPYQRNNFYFDMEDIEYVASTGYAQIRVANSSRFLYQYLHTNLFVSKVLLRCTGTSYPAINSSDLGGIPVCYPSSSEQQKIAAFLTAVDDKIQQLNKKKSLLEKYKKGVMQQIFNQKIRFKDENGVEYPQWEETALRNVCKINPNGSHLPDRFIYIDLESVVRGSLIKENSIKRDDAPSRAQRVLEPGDILFQMVRPYQGNNLFFDRTGDYVASTGYAQLRTMLCARYIYHYLHNQDFVNDVIARCTGTSYPAISSENLSQIQIMIPNIAEQTKIANFLSSLDDKIKHVDQQVELTKQYKKGLLQQMFV